MLDYAANALLYWPVEVTRTRLEKTCELQGTGPLPALASLQKPSTFPTSWNKPKRICQSVPKTRVVA